MVFPRWFSNWWEASLYRPCRGYRSTERHLNQPNYAICSTCVHDSVAFGPWTFCGALEVEPVYHTLSSDWIMLLLRQNGRAVKTCIDVCLLHGLDVVIFAKVNAKLQKFHIISQQQALGIVPTANGYLSRSFSCSVHRLFKTPPWLPLHVSFGLCMKRSAGKGASWQVNMLRALTTPACWCTETDKGALLDQHITKLDQRMLFLVCPETKTNAHSRKYSGPSRLQAVVSVQLVKDPSVRQM